ncbi:hypothetical protein A0H81_09607 [Grifola frondosa]|uniref:Uncharacterized protein n=1 Tax=Grifola frondosa TaxID=5627 RepID=A0A1C7M060_GRIFR|nr:hypothetical protein A0H81_09607 [Grifola frondosa]
MAHHSIFYAVAQAVFLIFCFRWRDLLEVQEDVDEFAAGGGPAKKWMARARCGAACSDFRTQPSQGLLI